MSILRDLWRKVMSAGVPVAEHYMAAVRQAAEEVERDIGAEAIAGEEAIERIYIAARDRLAATGEAVSHARVWSAVVGFLNDLTFPRRVVDTVPVTALAEGGDANANPGESSGQGSASSANAGGDQTTH